MNGTVDGCGCTTGAGVGNAGGGNEGEVGLGTVTGFVIGCGATGIAEDGRTAVVELVPPPPMSVILGAVVSLTRTVRVTGSA